MPAMLTTKAMASAMREVLAAGDLTDSERELLERYGTGARLQRSMRVDHHIFLSCSCVTGPSKVCEHACVCAFPLARAQLHAVCWRNQGFDCMARR